MSTIHIVTIEVTDDYRRLNIVDRPDYENWGMLYRCAFPDFYTARQFAKKYIDLTFSYLGDDWKLEIEDHETEIRADYNGGYVAVASIEYCDFAVTAQEAFL